jgi:polysaccharide export outer membrane protein
MQSDVASLRIERYRVDLAGMEKNAWQTPAAPAPTVAAVPNGVPDTAAVAATAGNVPAPAPAAGTVARTLRQGDRVSISLRGIRPETEWKDVIDDRGELNMPLLGPTHVEGKTTWAAESVIEDAYVARGYYKSINVTIVCQEDEFFIRGEIVRPSRYPLSTGLTLTRAIITAGSYTDFADPRKISIFRGDKVFKYDAKKIEKLEEKDPVILPDDVIVVAQKIIL